MKPLVQIATLGLALVAVEAHSQTLTATQTAQVVTALANVPPGNLRLIVHTGSNQAALADSLSVAFQASGWRVITTTSTATLRPCKTKKSVCFIQSGLLTAARKAGILAALSAASVATDTLTLPDITYDWPGSVNAAAIVLDIG